LKSIVQPVKGPQGCSPSDNLITYLEKRSRQSIHFPNGNAEAQRTDGIPQENPAAAEVLKILKKS
jgi:hypothetical protein